MDNSLLVKIARDHHPNWEECNNSIRRLFIRNVCIMLGSKGLEPSKFCVYWHTNNNKISNHGGTNHSLRIAETYGIPYFNIGKPNELESLVKFVDEYNNAPT